MMRNSELPCQVARVAHPSRRSEAAKKSKQLILRLTDKAANERKGERLSLLCDLCVLCAFA
jgi:hypothetical protein